VLVSQGKDARFFFSYLLIPAGLLAIEMRRDWRSLTLFPSF
jgi:hypothetical protein